MTTKAEIARARWEALWTPLGVSAPASDAFEELLAAYLDERRHYHTFDHVLDCLSTLDRFAHLACRPHEVEMALWYHDAVYDARRPDNEAASARWAGGVLRDAGVCAEAVDRIRKMILVTCHAQPPSTSDEQLVLDIDLSILGRAPQVFDQYQQQIRREFAWVPEEAFRSARSAVLSSFLRRRHIFHTEELRAHYEVAARENLASALRALSEA